MDATYGGLSMLRFIARRFSVLLALVSLVSIAKTTTASSAVFTVQLTLGGYEIDLGFSNCCPQDRSGSVVEQYLFVVVDIDDDGQPLTPLAAVIVSGILSVDSSLHPSFFSSYSQVYVPRRLEELSYMVFPHDHHHNGGIHVEANFGVAVQAFDTPLPGALPLFATGLAGLGWLARRRMKYRGSRAD
jgi:hypothetical protein